MIQQLYSWVDILEKHQHVHKESSSSVIGDNLEATECLSGERIDCEIITRRNMIQRRID